jgi:hypothetical protein
MRKPSKHELALAEAVQLLAQVFARSGAATIPQATRAAELVEPILAAAGPSVKTKGQAPAESPQSAAYEKEFAQLWRAWRGRTNNSRKAALKQYVARRRQGVSFEDLKVATVAYYRYCKAHGIQGTDKMKMAQTFFGPNEHWKSDYTLPPEEPTELGHDETSVDY